MANSYIVDIQGFKSMSNEFLMKEVCIIGVDNDYSYHVVIKPPFCYARLGSELLRRVDFLTRRIHGLEWDWGWVNETDVISVMKKILTNADKVYVKGSERVAFLERLVKRPVVDLDIFEYPAIDESKYCSCYCALSRHSRLRCAFKKAVMYKEYLLKSLEKTHK